MQLSLTSNNVGGIAQWQSIRLQIERSPVQLRLPPTVFLKASFENAVVTKCLLYPFKTYIATYTCIVYVNLLKRMTCM